MLVVSRKVGERVFIGDKISVTVIKIAGGGVRIGIDAPPELPIVREELADEVNREAQLALDGARDPRGEGERFPR